MEFGKAAFWSDARVGCKSLSAVLEGAQGRAYNGLLFAVVGAKGIHDKSMLLGPASERQIAARHWPNRVALQPIGGRSSARVRHRLSLEAGK